MKKQLLLSGLLLASLSATFVSCKKDDDEKSRKDLITGTWNVKGTGFDANANGTLEESEYDAQFKQVIAFGASVKQVFSADGNGSLSFTIPALGGDTANFTWSLADDDQTLRVRQEGDTTAQDATISRLDENQFEYAEKDGNPRLMFLLTR